MWKKIVLTDADKEVLKKYSEYFASPDEETRKLGIALFRQEKFYKKYNNCVVVYNDQGDVTDKYLDHYSKLQKWICSSYVHPTISDFLLIPLGYLYKFYAKK